MKYFHAFVFLFLALAVASGRGDQIEEGFQQAEAMIQKGDLTKAKDRLEVVLASLSASDRRVVRYHERVGAVLLREGNVNEARASFISALQAIQRLKVNDEFSAKSYVGMGVCLRREKNDGYALKYFKKALTFRLDEGTRMFAEDQIREIKGTANEGRAVLD